MPDATSTAPETAGGDAAGQDPTATQPNPDATSAGQQPNDPPAKGDDGNGEPDKLGEGGKAALDAERKARRKAEAELAKLKRQAMTEQEQAVEDARREGRQSANATLIGYEVRLAAQASGFHDPADAAALLAGKLEGIEVDEDGTVNAQAVAALVEDLAKSKPHLVADGQQPAPRRGGGDPNATGGGNGAPKAGKAALDNMIRQGFGIPSGT